MRIRFRAALITAVAAMGLVAGSVVPAHAATGWDRCPKGKLCLFDGNTGTGAMVAYTKPQARLGSWDNKANSVYNRTGNPWMCLYTQPDYSFTDPAHQLAIRNSGSGNDELELASESFGSRHLLNNLSSIRWAKTFKACGGDPEYIPWYNLVRLGPRPAAPFGDLNKDGTPDLLQRTYFGRLWYLRADGTVTLVGSGWNAMGLLTRHGDFTGDGSEDLIARDKAGELWLYPGNGRGTFGSRKAIGPGWNSMTALQATGDLNGDAKDDAVGRDRQGELWLYPGNGHGGFGARKAIGPGWTTMGSFAAPGDYTGDHRNDLLASDSSGRLWLYPGNGHGGFGTRKKIGAGGWRAFPNLVGVGDMNGTGHTDDFLAAQPDSQGQLRVYHKKPDGTLLMQGPVSYTEVNDTFV